MQEITKQTIRTLQRKTNHSLSVDDLDLISELDEAAAGISGATNIEYRLLRTPFETCGILFYPLTVAKALWFEEKVAEWDIEPDKQGAFLLWLLTLPLNSEALEEYSTLKKVNRAVRKFGRRLHCTDTELADVYNKCTNKTDDNEEPGGDVVNHGGLIAGLVKEYGGSPDEWLYERPISLISSLFAVMLERNAEEQVNAGRKDGKAVAPVNSRRIAALAKYRKVANKIEEAWNG